MDAITGVFEGGGIRGVALAGAAAATIDAGYRFECAVGTSAGAIVSSLVAAGYTSDEMRQMVVSVDWPGLVPDKNGLSKNLSMVFRLGFYSGAPLRRIIEEALHTKGIRTFGDLDHDALRVVATDLNHGRGVVFPNDLPELGYTPDEFSVVDAVLMSSTVPFLFEPVRLEDRTTGEELLMADGAMAARFPAQLVPRVPTTVGFRLRLPPDNHIHHEIDGPVSMATAVMAAGITAREDLPPLCGRLDNVVDITVDHDSLDFDVDPQRAAEMFEIGYESARLHLEATPVDST
ncbi:MAG: patatin-like phospholipase family protein [Halobacteriales archaeon]|nr:patatin-like phospholipase family protein [Halobacteriales archaeon]